VASGWGLAHALGKAGMKVAIADFDQSGRERAVGELRAKGVTALPVALDVRDGLAWEQAVDLVERDLGPVQVLCSNAGVGGSKLPIEQTTWEGWKWTMEVNLDSVFHGFKTCLPRMRKHGLPSHIVCTASLGGLLVIADNGVYSATKAGVIALCEAVAQETAGSNIGVSVLCPGLVQTSLLKNRERLKPGQFDIGALEPDRDINMGTGIDAMQLGGQVVAWMREGRFWMITHPELRPHVEARCEAIRDGNAGTLTLLASPDDAPQTGSLTVDQRPL
jgi:NAD(P)-dependent dehydrogenase (short-subunit alcohol dehydrogenase family)